MINWSEFEPSKLKLKDKPKARDVEVSEKDENGKQKKDGKTTKLKIWSLDLVYTMPNGRDTYFAVELPKVVSTPFGIKSDAKTNSSAKTYTDYKVTLVLPRDDEDCAACWETFVPAFHNRLIDLILDNYDLIYWKADKKTREQRRENIMENWELSLPFFKNKDKETREIIENSDPMTVVHLANFEKFKTVFTDMELQPFQDEKGKPMSFFKVVDKLSDVSFECVPVVTYLKMEVCAKYQLVKSSMSSAIVLDIVESELKSQQVQTSEKYRAKYGEQYNSSLREKIALREKTVRRSSEEDDPFSSGTKPDNQEDLAQDDEPKPTKTRAKAPPSDEDDVPSTKTKAKASSPVDEPSDDVEDTVSENADDDDVPVTKPVTKAAPKVAPEEVSFGASNGLGVPSRRRKAAPTS